MNKSIYNTIDAPTQLFLARVAAEAGFVVSSRNQMMMRETETGFEKIGDSQAISLNSTDRRFAITTYADPYRERSDVLYAIFTSPTYAADKPFDGSQSSVRPETLHVILPQSLDGQRVNPEVKHSIAKFLIQTGQPEYVALGRTYGRTGGHNSNPA